jgi:hypothetical protein
MHGESVILSEENARQRGAAFYAGNLGQGDIGAGHRPAWKFFRWSISNLKFEISNGEPKTTNRILPIAIHKSLRKKRQPSIPALYAWTAELDPPHWQNLRRRNGPGIRESS